MTRQNGRQGWTFYDKTLERQQREAKFELERGQREAKREQRQRESGVELKPAREVNQIADFMSQDGRQLRLEWRLSGKKKVEVLGVETARQLLENYEKAFDPALGEFGPLDEIFDQKLRNAFLPNLPRR